MKEPNTTQQATREISPISLLQLKSLPAPGYEAFGRKGRELCAWSERYVWEKKEEEEEKRGTWGQK